jgi:hypothetical protein
MRREAIRISGFIGAIALALIAANAARAAEPISIVPEVRLTMVGGHYVVESAQFNDLAGVDAWLRTRNFRVVAIDRCGSTTAPQLFAAVERFYPATAGVLEIRTLPAEAPQCAHDAAPTTRTGWVGFMREEDYKVRDESGRSMIP